LSDELEHQAGARPSKFYYAREFKTVGLGVMQKGRGSTEKDQITHQALGDPTFAKRDNIETETLFTIAPSKFQYV
jgi:hypothetical protein